MTGFVLGLLVVFAALETLVRWKAPLFAAASHRALTKAAIFDLHPDVSVLFLGTSRTQDGVSPPLVTRALKESAPELGNLAGFNAAFTGSSLEALMALAPRFYARKGMRLVVIELSGPQITNDPSAWEEPALEDKTIDDKLARAAREIAFIRYRKAFIPENFGRLIKLMAFGSSLSGWETRTSDQIASWRGRQEASAADFDAKLWSPEVFAPTVAPQPLKRANEEVCVALLQLVQQFQAQGVKVAFAVPPLSKKWKRAAERDQLRPLFSEIARRGQCEVWNYSELPLNDRFFGNPSHLGSVGRAHYSAALAVQVARILKN